MWLNFKVIKKCQPPPPPPFLCQPPFSGLSALSIKIFRPPPPPPPKWLNFWKVLPFPPPPSLIRKERGRGSNYGHLKLNMRCWCKVDTMQKTLSPDNKYQKEKKNKSKWIIIHKINIKYWKEWFSACKIPILMLWKAR